MSVHADTIPALAWAVVEKIADSDAGGWLMEFTARNVIRQRDALVAENQASEKLALYEHEQRLKAEAENQRLRDALAPFLKAAADYEPHHAERPDDSWVLLVESQDGLAARAALDAMP